MRMLLLPRSRDSFHSHVALRHASDYAPFISPTVYEMYSGGSMGGGAGRAGRMGGGARW